MFSRKKSWVADWFIPAALAGITTSWPVPIAAHSDRAQVSFAQKPFVVADAVTDNAVEKGTTIWIDGSSSMATVNLALKERFEAQYPGVKVELQYRGTEAALQALRAGKGELAAIGRPLTAEEKAAGLIPIALPRKKVAVVVGANNPFQGSLTDEQFAKICRGEITDWSEVGAAPGKIRLVDRPQSDTRLGFLIYPVFQAAEFVTGKTVVELEEDSTAATIEALGTDGISYAIADQAVEQPGLRIVLMHTTPITDSRYPFSQPRYYVYKSDKGKQSDAVREFVDFVDSASGQETMATASPSQPAAIAAGSSPSPTSGIESADASQTNAAEADTDSIDTGADPTSSADTSQTDSDGVDSDSAANADSAVGSETTSSSGVPQVNGDQADTSSSKAESDPSRALLPPWFWVLSLFLFFLGLILWRKNRQSQSPEAKLPEAKLPKAKLPKAKLPKAKPLTSSTAAPVSGLEGSSSAPLSSAGESASATETESGEISVGMLPSQSAETAVGEKEDVVPESPPAREDSSLVNEDRGDVPDASLSGQKESSPSVDVGAAIAAGAIATGAVAAGSIAAQQSTDNNGDDPDSKATPSPDVTASVIDTHRQLMANSQTDCYVLDESQMAALQSTANCLTLDPGLYVVRIRSGRFNYWSENVKFPGEPWVLIWIHGGRFINKKTNVEVECTWSSLNGYDDTLTLEVLETTTLCGFFFDTHKDDNVGQVVLSILPDDVQ